jgi:V8-like Glu-specific endopeptidase
MSKTLTLSLAASLSLFSLLTVPGCAELDSSDTEIDTPRDTPPTDTEQRDEMAIRSRLVAGIDPTRWEGFYADGTARFATPSGVVDESAGVEPTTQMARGDGVLVLADGRKFRQRHEVFERMIGSALPSERDLTRSVIGTDTRTTVAYTDYTKYPWRATGTIMSKKTDTAGWCTAALIGPRLAITAGHCVFDQDTQAWMWNTWWSPGHRGTGSDRFPNGTPRQVVGLYSFDGWVDDGNTQHDVGFLILADAPNTASLGWFGFTNMWSASDHEGITATTLQYPGWSYTCADSPDASGQCMAFQYRGTGTVADSCSNKLAHNVDTNKGSSGSPFYRWLNGGRYIIGPHTNGLGSYCGLQRNAATILTSGKVGSACSLLGWFPSAYASAGCS